MNIMCRFVCNRNYITTDVVIPWVTYIVKDYEIIILAELNLISPSYQSV